MNSYEKGGFNFFGFCNYKRVKSAFFSYIMYAHDIQHR